MRSRFRRPGRLLLVMVIGVTQGIGSPMTTGVAAGAGAVVAGAGLAEPLFGIG